MAYVNGDRANWKAHLSRKTVIIQEISVLAGIAGFSGLIPKGPDASRCICASSPQWPCSARSPPSSARAVSAPTDCPPLGWKGPPLGDQQVQAACPGERRWLPGKPTLVSRQKPCKVGIEFRKYTRHRMASTLPRAHHSPMKHSPSAHYPKRGISPNTVGGLPTLPTNTRFPPGIPEKRMCPPVFADYPVFPGYPVSSTTQSPRPPWPQP